MLCVKNVTLISLSVPQFAYTADSIYVHVCTSDFSIVLH